MSGDQNAGRILSIKFDNSSFEKVEEFKYWGKTLKNPNYIQEEIKNKLKQGMLATILCRILCFLVSCQKI